MTYRWEDNFEPYLCVMCTYNMYLDRQYAVPFFDDNCRRDLAELYKEISGLCDELGEIIAQDFSAGDLFNDKNNLKPYCNTLMEICILEGRAVKLLDEE